MRRLIALVLLALGLTACASPRSGPREGGAAPGALTGMFIYMADAPVIALCGESTPRPVAMEADYKALEAAYLNERPQLGEWILVSVEGRVEPRPSAEEGQPPRETLIVQRFVGIWPGETCGNPRGDSPLRSTYWKLVRLNGAPVRVARASARAVPRPCEG